MNGRWLESRLFRDLAWNFLGTGLPLLVAVVAIPQLISAIGLARFGVLSLAWVVVGYFSLFDLGLGRAMTQLIAELIGRGRSTEIPTVVWVGMGLMIVLGILGGCTLWISSSFLVSKLSISELLRNEALAALRLLALGVPVVILGTGLRGVLEGARRFDIVNMVRIPLGMVTFLGPLAVLPFSHHLPVLVATLIVARAASCAIYLLACLHLYPELVRRAPFDLKVLRQLATFGGWMTISNIAGPLMLYLGRVLLAVMVSAEAVAYFSIPYDVVINLLIIPTTLVSVYFPLFAQHSSNNATEVRRLYSQSMVLNLAAIFPLTVITYGLAEPVLGWWLNADFSQKGSIVAQLIAVGVLVNSFGHISQALVQAHGRPDLTAKLHVVELIAYIPYLWWLIEKQGVTGAAVAWVLRVMFSTIALTIMAHWCISARFRSDRVKDEHAL